MKTVVSTSVLAAILSGCATHITPVIESGHEGVDEAQARGLADHYFVASDLEPSALHGLTRQQRHQSIRQGCSLDFYTITESLPQNLRWELRESVLASGHFGTYRRFVSDSTFNQGSYEIPGHLAADLAWFAEEFERTALMPLLLIIGHTNSDGGVRFNQSLSEKRAAAVYTFLIERGVPANRIQRFGVGETSPLSVVKASGASSMNRRVELVTFIPVSKKNNSVDSSCNPPRYAPSRYVVEPNARTEERS